MVMVTVVAGVVEGVEGVVFTWRALTSLWSSEMSALVRSSFVVTRIDMLST